MSQKPSVGRIVHFYKEGMGTPAGSSPPGYNGQGAGPYPAIVTQAFKLPDGSIQYVNLKVIPPFGKSFDEGSVSENTSERPASGRYWEWPPREAGQ